jgi:F-type H+-transporting ATPase subunit epsilon
MFKLKVVTPQSPVREFECTQINIVTPSGEMGVLSHHMPLVTQVKISLLTMIHEQKRLRCAVAGAVLFFQNNEATLMADAFELEGEIDLERAEKAKQRAEMRLKSNDENLDFKRAELALLRAINRMGVRGQ